MILVYVKDDLLYTRDLGNAYYFRMDNTPPSNPLPHTTYSLVVRFENSTSRMFLLQSENHQDILDRLNDITAALDQDLKVYDMREPVGYWKSD